jgi:hypothetical protein
MALAREAIGIDWTTRAELVEAIPPIFAEHLCLQILTANCNSKARVWKCDLGNGEWDHDWKETNDDAGQVDGGPGFHWTQRECRVCGEIESPNQSI